MSIHMYVCMYYVSKSLKRLIFRNEGNIIRLRISYIVSWGQGRPREVRSVQLEAHDVQAAGRQAEVVCA